MPHGKCHSSVLSLLSLLLFLFYFRLFSKHSHVVSRRKLEYWSHFHPVGLLRIPTPPDSLVPGFPDHLHRDCGGEPGMIMTIRVSPQLHMPMYFFLNHLSLVDFCYSTTATPKLLEILVVEDRTISFIGCIMQFFLACVCAVAEMFMLAVMAYD